MLTELQESNLTSYGNCFEHYHLEDRVVDRPKVLAIQELSPVKEITSSFACDDRWDYVVADTTSANITVTLPLAGNGREIEVTKFAAPHYVSIVPTGSDTITGATEVRLFSQWNSVRLKAITGGWVIV